MLGPWRPPTSYNAAIPAGQRPDETGAAGEVTCEMTSVATREKMCEKTSVMKYGAARSCEKTCQTVCQKTGALACEKTCEETCGAAASCDDGRGVRGRRRRGTNDASVQIHGGLSGLGQLASSPAAGVTGHRTGTLPGGGGSEKRHNEAEYEFQRDDGVSARCSGAWRGGGGRGGAAARNGGRTLGSVEQERPL